MIWDEFVAALDCGAFFSPPGGVSPTELATRARWAGLLRTDALEAWLREDDWLREGGLPAGDATAARLAGLLLTRFVLALDTRIDPRPLDSFWRWIIRPVPALARVAGLWSDRASALQRTIGLGPARAEEVQRQEDEFVRVLDDAAVALEPYAEAGWATGALRDIADRRRRLDPVHHNQAFVRVVFAWVGRLPAALRPAAVLDFRLEPQSPAPPSAGDSWVRPADLFADEFHAATRAAVEAAGRGDAHTLEAVRTPDHDALLGETGRLTGPSGGFKCGAVPGPITPGTWGRACGIAYINVCVWCDARLVTGALSVRAWPVGSIGLGSVFGSLLGDDRLTHKHRRLIPLGRLIYRADSPTPRVFLTRAILERIMANRKTTNNKRTQPSKTTPQPQPTKPKRPPRAPSTQRPQQPINPDTHPHPITPPQPVPRCVAVPRSEPAPNPRPARDEAEECARLADAPVVHSHAAGIDVGDRTHWVCVGSTPDNTDTVREFPAHTPGLRQLVAWLKACGVTTVALEASGAYGRVLYLTLLEASFHVVMTPPHFTRQIKGRPKTDKLDCQWIRRLHALGLLPGVFQPDDATHTLRDYVRQRANLVRLGAQHVQRMQKALELMNLKLTTVLGDVTGVTGLKIIRAIVAGERDPQVLAKMRDRRCKHTVAQIATALDGRYRPEHVAELRLCLKMWDAYQEAIADLDGVIEKHLATMRRTTALPELPKQTRVRGRKPHDPKFDVRTALYLACGVDLTAIEGIDAIHALTLVGELGSDFTKWPTVKHFTSWLGLCPNWQKTGGKVKSSRTRKGKNRAAHALRLAAWGLLRSKSYVGAFLRRQRSRLGTPKAVTATAHKLARILYHLMRYGAAYVKKTEDQFVEQQRQRQEKQLHRRAKELGYELKKIEAPGQPEPTEPTAALAT